jgi:hypothetical protein
MAAGGVAQAQGKRQGLRGEKNAGIMVQYAHGKAHSQEFERLFVRD